MRLVDRQPHLTADELVARLTPPQRFAGARFDTYVPNPDHPSQAAALRAMERFAEEIRTAGAGGGRRWFRRSRSSEADPGRYLDGGFGVGKTHLLASLWFASPEPKAYVSFEELTAIVGFLGMERAVELFAGYRLLCIDEFELDDVANTLMVVSFLRGVLPGTRVAATSNAIPDRLGEGRFNAEDFQREIAAIASAFDVVRIDGPDYRATSRATADALSDSALDALAAAETGTVSDDEFDALLAHLRRVHPAQLRALLDGVDTVIVRGMHPIANQGDALLFVQLVDELYDAEVRFGASGCGVGELFRQPYRNGGFRKKYGRAESRLAAMLGEARLPSG